MFFLFRFFFVANLIIFTSLLFSNFNPGGRYHILFEATFAAFFLQLIRIVINGRLPFREKGLLSSGGILITYIVTGILFKGVKLSWTGILFSYLGVLMVEILLPDEAKKTIYKK